jgi:preprotein translocase subunit SecA
MGFGHQNTRRGDRQLIGRAGRQGDPGVSRFFISPEDELLVRFGNEREKKPMNRRACLGAICHAQKTCEEVFAAQRESTLRLDEVIGQFRAEIYQARSKILEGNLPGEFAHLPPAMVQAVALSAIDEAWATFLREADDARQRCGVVSLVGRDYQREYIREVAAMFEAMMDGIKETMHRHLAYASEGVIHVDAV